MKKLFSSLLILTMLFGYSSLDATGLTVEGPSQANGKLDAVLRGNGDTVIADGSAASSSATLFMASKTSPISTFVVDDKGITSGSNFLTTFTDETSTDGDAQTKAKSAVIATITINNNTRDGFRLEVLSTNHANNGSLQLVATDSDRTHGEVDIPYSLSALMSAEGTIDTQSYTEITSKYRDEAAMIFDSGVCKLLDAGENGGSGDGGPVTHPLENLQVTIRMEITNNGLTAGNYADTITYRYTDL